MTTFFNTALLNRNNERKNENNSKGFTLIELLVVVSLIIIVVGVTGDIVVTLVRSYSKTQITNEVEQNANFALTKIEKELKSATKVNTASGTRLEFVKRLPNGTSQTIEYTVEDANGLPEGTAGVYYIARAVNGGSKVPVTNYTSPAGVTILQSNTSFTNVSAATGPSVVKINLAMRQVGNPSVQFTQNVEVETTVVIRGSY